MPNIVKPYNDTESKKKQVEQMFDNISENYDFLNRLLSFNIDIYWRNQLEKKVVAYNPGKILDVATGTADLAIEHAKKTKAAITGLDLSQKMLDYGQVKVNKKGLKDRIKLIKGDAEKLSFQNGEFDIVTVSFGVRNFENLEKGISEMGRVLKSGGKLLILEFSKPSGFFAPFFMFYFKKILPNIGKIISGDSQAYTYLPNSVDAMPYGEDMKNLILKNGFKEANFRKLTFGVATVYEGIK
ncbi:demethylmenaquinone methyltransferase / 2-methoxy-6-polyprenyl-1,4-benzoquinol methylase [Apibacter mensalis]|uniref:Demethylmenaquinone methyltransferase n=1 Tax=Apibacter mensalis TaxID=1586267 RepID=A0A0X3AN49_9FLAO|nr:bifunctional demethylmenaquinone methyltransferase/2-methoxy-6-polyprenyl-1,4-benzoquinol methylase UbiE [Apibacter mensalis]CVK15796.1 demethylmenaquinone methyltransferase / 2-methoxy-6-polyprenyl-1,4-benzoquinol methylase [Apibacter mensalis]